MRSLICATAVFGLVLGLGQTAQAGEVTRVASSFEEDNKFDLHFGVAYDFNFKRAAILREWNTGAADDNETHLVKDLIYQQQRHVLTPTLEIGLWHDLSVYFSLPIILHDQRDYQFDQRADDCQFGDDERFPNVTCVNERNSTTIRDGIVPADGIDATDTGAPYDQFRGDTEGIFIGPNRRGVDQFHVGIKYGILNQNKLTHMPNWVVGAEGRFAVGRAMRFSRDIRSDPAGNGRVGRRIHELGLWTALSRRYRFLDPFFTAFWRQSLRANGSAFQNFEDEGAQDKVNPQSTTGVTFGTEIVPWERKAKSQKVSLLFEGTATLHYDGRGYSEVWELLADSPAMLGSFDPTQGANCTPQNAVDAERNAPDLDNFYSDGNYIATGGSSCEKFQGVTDIQDYGTFGTNFALNVHMGKFARLILGTRIQTDTRHFLTFTNRGDAGDNDFVDPNTREVNPMRRDVVDDVGRRYVIDDVFDFVAYLNFWLTF